MGVRNNMESAARLAALYAELLSFHEELLSATRENSASRAPPSIVERTLDPAILEDRVLRLRRRYEFWRGQYWEGQGVRLDSQRRLLRYGGRAVELTRREAQLLSLLLRHRNRYVTAYQVTCLAWQNPDLSPDQVRTYIMRLRRRFETLGLPCRLQSHARDGYALVWPDE